MLGDAPRLARVLKTDAHEGPVYVADEDALYFTTLPRPGRARPGRPSVAIKRLALDGERFPARARASLRRPRRRERGQRHDPRPRRPPGRLRAGHAIAARRASPASTARPARVETVVDRWRGRRAATRPTTSSSRATAAIWFTDPSYGHLQGFRPAPAGRRPRLPLRPRGRATCRSSPTTSTSRTASRSRPTSACSTSPTAAPTRSRAASTPSRPHHVVAFDVVDGRELADGRLFAVITPGFPDGIKVDSEGRVYVSSFSGVQVFDPAGELLGEIAAARRRELHLRRPGPQRPLHHHRRRGLGRRAQRRPDPSESERSLTMAIVRTRRIIDDKGADAVIAAAEKTALAGRPSRRDRRRRPLRRADPAAPHSRRADRELARRRRQGAHRGDLRPPQPRDRGAGDRRAPRRARAARRRGLTGGDPAEGRRRGRRRDRHERRDARRGRGGLDRRRGGGVLDHRGPRADLRGRAARGRGRRRRRRRARRRPGRLRRRRRRRADLPAGGPTPRRWRASR